MLSFDYKDEFILSILMPDGSAGGKQNAWSNQTPTMFSMNNVTKPVYVDGNTQPGETVYGTSADYVTGFKVLGLRRNSYIYTNPGASVTIRLLKFRATAYTDCTAVVSDGVLGYHRLSDTTYALNENKNFDMYYKIKPRY